MTAHLSPAARARARRLDQAPPAPPAGPDLAELVAATLDAALDALGISGPGRELAYRAAEAQLGEVDR